MGHAALKYLFSSRTTSVLLDRSVLLAFSIHTLNQATLQILLASTGFQSINPADIIFIGMSRCLSRYASVDS